MRPLTSYSGVSPSYLDEAALIQVKVHIVTTEVAAYRNLVPVIEIFVELRIRIVEEVPGHLCAGISNRREDGF